MATLSTLTAERLRELLEYAPETGAFTWRASQKGKPIRAGTVAGYLHASGYRKIRVDWKCYRASRLAWFYMKGEWPLHEMDHVNFDRADDRLVNLREATSAQNKGHRRAKTNSMSGVKGVYWSHPRRKWQAQLMLGKRNIYLGLFDSLWDARVAYVIAATKEFGEFATFHSRDDEVWVKERLAETMGLP